MNIKMEKGGISTLGEPMPKREWTYTTSQSKVVNHPNYAQPVIKVRFGTVYVKEYEKDILWGLFTIVKTKKETVWDDDFKIIGFGSSNV